MKQLEVQIMGQSYLLSCPDGGDIPLLEAVERVDTAMCKIRDAGKVRARERIAVLAALNLAFELSGRAVASPPPLKPSDLPLNSPSNAAFNSSSNSAFNSSSNSAFNSSSTASSTSPSDADSQQSPDANTDQLLSSLLERLDVALNDDGRLL